MAKPLTFEVNKYSCVVPLSMSQMLKLMKISYLDFIFPTLSVLGASDIEYDGHFGPNFFFSVEKMEDAQNVTSKLSEILDTPVKNLPKED